jgi:uncharacterized membrane protein
LSTTPPITTAILPHLIAQDKVEPTRYLAGLEAFRDDHFWDGWALKSLFALGVGHVLAGIIFFFAHNWFDFPDMAKFAIVGGGIAISALIWILLKLDSLVAQAFGIAATVLVGVMFAVFGQVYQTPALLHTPFVLWAFMTLPFAAVSRNLAHYTVWIIIAGVAMFAYAETGFYIAGKPLLADALILVSALIMMLGLLTLDRFLIPKYDWARAQWFRLFLIAVCAGLLVSAFTSTFWPWRNVADEAFSYLLSLGAFGGAIGLVAYLYKFKPTLAGLSLVTVGVSAMIVQIVIKIFQDSGWGFEIFLLIFLIFAGLTVGLAFVLKHFADITRKAQVKDSEETQPIETNVPQIAKAVNLAEDDIISAATAIEANDNPWYIELFIALAAIVTACFGFTFFGLMFAAILNDANIGLALCVLGVPFYAGALFLRRKNKGGYLRHLLNTLIMVGAAMIVGGFLLAFENKSDFIEDGLVVLVIVLALINIYCVKDKIIEFLSVFLALNAIYFYLSESLNLPYENIILGAFSIALGVFLLTRMVGKRIYSAAAFALLLYPTLMATFPDSAERLSRLLGEIGDETFSILMFVEPAIGVIIAGLAIVYLNKVADLKSFRPPLVFLLPILAILILFPFGGAFAFLLMVAGYILGNRLLALFGILFQIYYLYMFYYELSISLGVKSYILLAVGVVLIAIWAFANKTYQASVPS